MARAEGEGRGFASTMGDIASGIGTAFVAAAAAIGTALIGVGVASFNVGREFDNAMGAVRAQTALTQYDIADLRTGFEDMALAGGFSARELAAAYSDIAVMGQDTADALNIMSAAQTLALATGEDLGRAAYFVGNYLLKVGADSSYADKYIDLFAQGIRNTGISLADMQNYMFRMTPAFEQFGADSEANVAILTRMYQAGIRGANLYSGMGTIMMEFGTQSGKAFEALGSFGYALEYLIHGTHDWGGALNQLTDSQRDHLQILQEQIFAAETNEEAMFAVAQAMNIASQYLDEYGRGGLIAADITDNLNQTQQAAWFEFMNLAEEIQNEVIPAFDSYGVAAEMAELRGGGMEESLRILGNTMEWAKLQVWDFIATPIAETLAGAADQLQGLATRFVPLFGEALGGLVGMLTGAEGASDRFSGAIGGLADEIAQTLPAFLERGIQIVLSLVDGVAQAMPTLVNGIAGILPSVVRSLAEALPQIQRAGYDVVLALIDGVTEMLPEIIVIFAELLPTLIANAIEFLPLLIEAGLKLILSLVDGIIQAAPYLIRAVVELIPALIDALLASIPLIIQAGIDLLIALVDALPVIITEIVAAIPVIIDGIITALMENLPAIIAAGFDLLVALVTNLPQVLLTLASVMPRIIMAMVTALWDNRSEILQIGKDLLLQLRDGILSMLEAIGESAMAVGTRIWEAITGFATDMWQAGKDLISGLIRGVTDMAGAAVGAVMDVGRRIMDGVRGFFRISSPSRVFAEIGEYLMEGLAAGIKAKADDATEEAQKAAMDAANAAGRGAIAATNQWLEVARRGREVSAREEVDLWMYVTNSVVKGTQAREDAERRLHNARLQLAREQEQAQGRITQLEANYTQALDRAANALLRPFSLFDEFAHRAPDTSRQDAEVAAYERVIAIEQKLADLRHNEHLTDRERHIERQGLMAELAVARDAHAAAEMEAAKTQGEILYRNLQSQRDALYEYVASIDALASRGIYEGLLDEIRGFGVAATADIQALNEKTDAELAAYVELWREMQELAREAAISELEPLREQTDAEIRELADHLKYLGGSVFVDAGKAAVEGYAKGMTGFADIAGQMMQGGTQQPIAEIISPQAIADQVNLFSTGFSEIVDIATQYMESMSQIVDDITRRMVDAMYAYFRREGFNTGRALGLALGQGLISTQAMLLQQALSIAASIRAAFAVGPTGFSAPMAMSAPMMMSAADLMPEPAYASYGGGLVVQQENNFYGVTKDETPFLLYRATQQAARVEGYA